MLSDWAAPLEAFEAILFTGIRASIGEPGWRLTGAETYLLRSVNPSSWRGKEDE